MLYFPESASHLLGHALYMFDYNVRQTSILGLVGAGGIGFYIITYIKYFDYGSAMVFMAVVLGTVLAIDWISVRVRDAYIVKPQKRNKNAITSLCIFRLNLYLKQVCRLV